TAREHLLHSALPLDERLRDAHHVTGLVGQEAGGHLRVVLVTISRDRSLDGRPHGPVVGEELRVRLGVVALGVVHVALGRQRRILAGLPSTPGEGTGDHGRTEHQRKATHERSSSMTSTCEAWAASSRAVVLSTSNFGSSASIERKKRSSLASLKRSDSK